MSCSCSLPQGDAELINIAGKVQRHTNSKSCKMKGANCRFGFPTKLVISKTTLAKPLPDEMDKDEKEDILKKANTCLIKAVEIQLTTELWTNIGANIQRDTVALRRS